MGGIQGWHIVIIVVLAIVLFGAPKLPGMARSVGQSLRIFKSEVKQMKDENSTPDDATGPVEGRVVSNPAPQTYAPTYQAPAQQQYPQQYVQPQNQQPAPQHAQPQHPVTEGQAEGPAGGATQAGRPQGGTPHSSQ